VASGDAISIGDADATIACSTRLDALSRFPSSKPLRVF
jgi:hypothetical protein